MVDEGLRRTRRLLAVLASGILVCACPGPDAKTGPITVRNPDYLVVRPIRREPDAEHTQRVDLPHSGEGYGFASPETLLDLNSVDLARVAFAGGRTSIAGEATIWLPLTPDGNSRLAAWSARHPEDSLGIFIDGKLVAAPRIEGAVGGGIPLRVPSKMEGDAVIEELRNGGAARSAAPEPRVTPEK